MSWRRKKGERYKRERGRKKGEEAVGRGGRKLWRKCLKQQS